MKYFYIFFFFLTYNSCYAQGTWSQISNFGSNPGNLDAYKYVPQNMPENAPLVMVIHGCTQSASSISATTKWNALADIHKFYVVYPEQKSANHSSYCFNYWEPGDHSRNEGEALSMKQMVDHMKANYSIDNNKVFATGLSAGGAMTIVMCAVYPDVFSAGAEIAGLPYKVATNSTGVYLAALGQVTKTPQQWGDLVRNAFPSFTGTYPRMAIFHGTSDNTISDVNATETMKQFTNLHGTDQTADYTVNGFNGASSVTQRQYTNGNDEIVVVSYIVNSMGHGVPIDPGNCYQQGGAAGSYAYDVDLHSSFWAAHFFGILQLPFDITGLNQVNINQQGVAYSVPNTSGSSYAWEVPTGASIVSGQSSNSITVNWGTTSGIVRVTETASDNCKKGPAELFVEVGAFTGIENNTENTENTEAIISANANTIDFSMNSINEKYFDILIYDLNGKIIFQEKNLTTNKKYSLSKTTGQGIYIAHFTSVQYHLMKKIAVN